MISSPISSWQIGGEKVETVTDFIFLGSKITADSDCSHEIKRQFLLELMLLNCSVGEYSWESLGLQGDPTSQSENKSWIFIGRTDAETETPILWPCDTKNWLIGKDSDAGKDWTQEKEMTEDEIVGWHHQLNGHEFEQDPGVGDGQGSLACCSPRGHKKSDRAEWLNWTNTVRFLFAHSTKLFTQFNEEKRHNLIQLALNSKNNLNLGQLWDKKCFFHLNTLLLSLLAHLGYLL